MVFECEITLVVLDAAPASDEIRAFWILKENAVLDVAGESDRLWLGRTRAVTPEEPSSPGPAGRVFDLMYLKGTTPDYTAPVITETLVDEIMVAFRGPDDSGLPATDPERLEAFLTEHLGKRLVTD